MTRHRILPLLLLVIACGLAVQLYRAEVRVARAEQALQRMAEHASAMEHRVVQLEQEQQRLESRTVERIIDNAGDALLDRWSDLADHFASEMEKLGRALEEKEEQQHETNDKQGNSPI